MGLLRPRALPRECSLFFHGLPSPDLLDGRFDLFRGGRREGGRWGFDEVNLLVELLPRELSFLGLPLLEAVRDEPALPPVPYRGDLLHGLESLLHDVPVVPLRPVPLSLELEGRVVREVLSARGSVGFRPLHLARVALHFEVVVALGTAEAEYRAVVSGVHDPPPGVDVRRAKPARFQPHGVVVRGE